MALNTSLTDVGADSYVTLEEATAYFDGGLYGDAWAAVTNQEAALREAAKWLNTLTYPGECCVAGRFLAWPRQGATCCCEDATCGMVPAQVKQAQMELALQLGTNPGLLTGGVGSAGAGVSGPVKRERLGDLEREFFAPSENSGASTSTVNPNAPTLLQKLPWISDLLGCWLDVSSLGNCRIIARVRS